MAATIKAQRGKGGGGLNPEETLISATLKSQDGRGWSHDAEATYVAHALTGEGHDASEDGTGRGTPLIAAPLSHGSNPNSNMAGRRREDDENLVAGPLGGGNDGIGRRSEDDPNLIAQAGVRRLTPTECERLQALPDGWTNPLGDAPDSRRYAALGDAVTSSVAEWIGRRLLRAVA